MRLCARSLRSGSCKSLSAIGLPLPIIVRETSSHGY